jgi:hypothetical protein
LWLLSFSLFGVGIWLFYTRRVERLEDRLDKLKGSQRAEAGIPSDIHNYILGGNRLEGQRPWILQLRLLTLTVIEGP